MTNPSPARTDHGVTGQAVEVRNVEQGMDEATVADIDLGRLDQALADIGRVGAQPPHQEQVDQEVDVAGHWSGC